MTVSKSNINKTNFFMFVLVTLDNGDVNDDAIRLEHLQPTTSLNNSEVRNKIITD
jgi:hypothetical protein